MKGVSLHREERYGIMIRTNTNKENMLVAPYRGWLDKMNRNEKIAVALFLVDSLPDVEIVEKDKKQEMNAEDEAFLAKKLKDLTFSPRIERLFEKRKEVAQEIDLDDSRTRHILGL